VQQPCYRQAAKRELHKGFGDVSTHYYDQTAEEYNTVARNCFISICQWTKRRLSWPKHNGYGSVDEGSKLKCMTHICKNGLLYACVTSLRRETFKDAFDCTVCLNATLGNIEIISFVPKHYHTSTQIFLLYKVTCFELFKRSSSGLQTDWVKRCCVHVGNPICLHR